MSKLRQQVADLTASAEVAEKERADLEQESTSKLNAEMEQRAAADRAAQAIREIGAQPHPQQQQRPQPQQQQPHTHMSHADQEQAATAGEAARA